MDYGNRVGFWRMLDVLVVSLQHAGKYQRPA
jgi:hypothetical protein